MITCSGINTAERTAFLSILPNSNVTPDLNVIAPGKLRRIVRNLANTVAILVHTRDRASSGAVSLRRGVVKEGLRPRQRVARV